MLLLLNDEQHEEHAMHSKSDNIEMMINDKPDEVMEALFHSLLSRCER